MYSFRELFTILGQHVAEAQAYHVHSLVYNIDTPTDVNASISIVPNYHSNLWMDSTTILLTNKTYMTNRTTTPALLDATRQQISQLLILAN